ncbi:ATP phosphoribosyltransferase regulatory subunit [Methylobacterium sp. Leaf399]|uniref:ATP phosphoribosyltransferase regulatory subunit n=1 Tax=unclassified Methylobacterium TaxID=2615210 RepID=UPI0006F934DD|nr:MULTISPECIES: ATP phosphoribosyltransferase regulatory subunit [unclassified Methylobacterium]KQP58526.1 ATP phosphoribosyltransferase regulatory subunit [Methylobacterium sp. Leaf108]KQT11973.1 ATP phosphoribosyltransferase regulatory subunit [Methylobacterium sp. Leaf399]KQT88725.1 ATP phosphoribosyltransferase regulatory subunit [Methylobacterium sp. Leaf466]
MTRPEAGGASDDGRRQAALAAHFAAQGYGAVTPPVLQPVEPFLELSGEDIRRRIFVTQDAAGAEYCLRPEFTIPVCRHHLTRGLGAGADYSYLGPVFRLARGEPDEFLQAGIESIGRVDVPAADAEVVGLALEGLALFGRTEVVVRLGDMGLTHSFLDALAVPPAAKRRTLRALAGGRSLDEVANAASVEDPHAGLLSAIQGQDPRGVRAFVEDVLSIAGISRVGGRSAGEIAERFLAKAAAQANGGAGLNAENRALIERYRAIDADPDRAAGQIRALARDAGLDHPPLDEAIGLVEERTGFMAARGLEVERFRFSAGFARNLDYYTGMIFEVTDTGAATVLVGGGRYDGLLQHLGSPVPVPAVGCAFWLARMAA